MAKAQQQTATHLPTCAACKCDVGKEAGCIPWNVDDSATTAGEKAKHETFCPQCFVFVRAPRESGRWMQGAFAPIKCMGCGLESVTMGLGNPQCMQCNSRTVVLLGPKPGVV